MSGESLFLFFLALTICNIYIDRDKYNLGIEVGFSNFLQMYKRLMVSMASTVIIFPLINNCA